MPASITVHQWFTFQAKVKQTTIQVKVTKTTMACLANTLCINSAKTMDHDALHDLKRKRHEIGLLEMIVFIGLMKESNDSPIGKTV